MCCVFLPLKIARPPYELFVGTPRAPRSGQKFWCTCNYPEFFVSTHSREVTHSSSMRAMCHRQIHTHTLAHACCPPLSCTHTANAKRLLARLINRAVFSPPTKFRRPCILASPAASQIKRGRRGEAPEENLGSRRRFVRHRPARARHDKHAESHDAPRLLLFAQRDCFRIPLL